MRAYEFSDYLPEDYDPTIVERSCSSFVWVNGKFNPVAYQSHSKFIAELAGVERPNSSEQFVALNAFVAKNGIVRGVFQPSQQSKFSKLASYLNLEGSTKAIRTCYNAFKKDYPELIANLDELYYDALGPDGHRLVSKRLEGNQIDRTFGRR